MNNRPQQILPPPFVVKPQDGQKSLSGPVQVLPPPIAAKPDNERKSVGAVEDLSRWGWWLGGIFTGVLAYGATWYSIRHNWRINQWLDVVTRFLKQQEAAGKRISNRILVANTFRPIAEIGEKLWFGDYEQYSFWEGGFLDNTPESRRRRAEKIVNERLKEFGYDFDTLDDEQREQLTEQSLNAMSLEKAGRPGFFESMLEF